MKLTNKIRFLHKANEDIKQLIHESRIAFRRNISDFKSNFIKIANVDIDSFVLIDKISKQQLTQQILASGGIAFYYIQNNYKLFLVILTNEGLRLTLLAESEPDSKKIEILNPVFEEIFSQLGTLIDLDP